MRLTQHSGRQGSPKHNDRTFDVSKADNIDTEKMVDNFYVNCIDKEKDFKLSEIEFYKRCYSDALKLSNEKKIKQRHPEKVRKIEDLYNSPKTRPEELILQIGDKNSNIDLDTFEKCAFEYINELTKWNKEHGNHMNILNYSCHYDETSPHLHLRRVWDYKDENGNLQINQNKALELAGIKPPKPDEKISRYNNRKMTFDDMMRKKWLDICEKNGIKVEREPIVDKKRNLSLKEFKYEQDKKVAIELKNDITKFLKDTMSDFKIMSGLDKKHKNNSDIVKANKRFIENANSFFKLLEDKYNMPIHTKAPEDDDLLKNSDWKYLSKAAQEDIEFDKTLSEIL